MKKNPDAHILKNTPLPPGLVGCFCIECQLIRNISVHCYVQILTVQTCSDPNSQHSSQTGQFFEAVVLLFRKTKLTKLNLIDISI